MNAKRDADYRVQTVCLIILATVATGTAMHWLRAVMIPFVLAVFTALGCSALTDALMQRLRWPRALALAGTLSAGLLAFAALGAIISASISQMIAKAATYKDQVAVLVEDFYAALPQELRRLAPAQGFDFFSEIPMNTVGELLASTTTAVIDVLSEAFLVLVFAAYLLIGGAQQGTLKSKVWTDIELQVKRYLLAKFLISAAVGALVGVILLVLGVDLAIVFGLLTFLLNFIPNVGPVIATLLPLPVVVVSPELSGTQAVLAMVLPTFAHMVIGHILEPKIFGDSLDLHPVVVLLTLILWGVIWGLMGMFLATPITAVLKILFEKFESTRPLAHLLAGRIHALRPRVPVEMPPAIPSS